MLDERIQELQLTYLADNPTMSESLQLQRPRASSMSESARPGEMIEEWPTSSARLRRTRAVSFSEFSSLYSYEKATTPVNELFYTKSERKYISKRDTVQEAIRIRSKLREGIKASGEDVPNLAQCCLESHEVVGIEHLVLHKVPKKISNVRKNHSEKVLLEQKTQRAARQNDPGRLAAESALISEKSSLEERRRADICI